jgi:hypothetical protein
MRFINQSTSKAQEAKSKSSIRITKTSAIRRSKLVALFSSVIKILRPQDSTGPTATVVHFHLAPSLQMSQLRKRNQVQCNEIHSKRWARNHE